MGKLAAIVRHLVMIVAICVTLVAGLQPLSAAERLTPADWPVVEHVHASANHSGYAHNTSAHEHGHETLALLPAPGLLAVVLGIRWPLSSEPGDPNAPWSTPEQPPRLNV